MLRKVFWCCCVLYTFFLNEGMAQTAGDRPRYVSSWGHLYREEGNKNDILGVFATEAPVYLIDSSSTQYKVQVSNGDIGFIDRQPLTSSMRGKRSAGEPVQYFYRGSQGYQCPHFYVQVAELRVRKGPSTASTAVRRSRLNEMVCIDYVPLYPDGWVYIGDHFHEKPEYLQMKYLGAELTYEKVLKDYLAVKGMDREKELAHVGRLRELAYTKVEHLLQALTYWKESYAAADVQQAKVDIDFELFLAERMAKKPSWKAYEQKMKALNLHFICKDMALFDGKITDAQMAKLQLDRVSSIPDFPECGWEPRYYYKNPNLIVPFEENQKKQLFGSVYKMYFTNGEMVVLGKERMDGNYSERDFVTHFGDLVSSDWIDSPHVYSLQNNDAGLFIFTFKAGKLYSYTCLFYC